MVENQQLPLLSIDVGGTKVRIIKYSPSLSPENETTIPTAEIFTTRSAKDLDTLFSAARDTAGIETESKFQTVGLSMKGAIKNGKIVYASLLGGAEGTAVEPLAAQQLQFNKFNVINDVVAMTRAELAVGKASDSSSLLFVNLGTGVRMCYAENGIIVEGNNGCAGEVGPQQIWSGEMNRYVAAESITSGRGLMNTAKYLLGETKPAEDIFNDNDQQLIRLFSKHLGEMIIHGVHFYNPKTVIFGGSVTLSADKWLEKLKEQLETLPKFQQPKTVAVSTLEYPASLGAVI